MSAYFIESSHNFNLIGINWETASATINYYSASNNVDQVGTYTAELIDYLVMEKLMNLDSLTLVGFSLGAHAAGIGIYLLKKFRILFNSSVKMTNCFVFCSQLVKK